MRTQKVEMYMQLLEKVCMYVCMKLHQVGEYVM